MTVESSSNVMGRRWWPSIVAVLVLAAPGWGQTTLSGQGEPLTAEQKQLSSQAVDYWLNLLLQAIPPVDVAVITKALAAGRALKQGLEPKNDGRVRSSAAPHRGGNVGSGACESERTLDGGIKENTSEPWVGQEFIVIVDWLFDCAPPALCEEVLMELGIALLHEALHTIQNFKEPPDKNLSSYSESELRAKLSALEAELEAYYLTLTMISVMLNRIDAILENQYIPEDERERWEATKENWIANKKKLERQFLYYYDLRTAVLFALPQN